MAEQSEFVARILRLLVPLGAARARPMFGGHGLFMDDVMFALITRQEVLHFRADDQTRGAYEAQGLGRHGRMPYFEVPRAAFDDADEFMRWAQDALAAARRNPTKKKTKGKRG